MSSITILDENDKSELNQNISTKSPKLHTHTTDDIEGIFTVASGGTGVGSLDANKVLYATSESAIGQMSIPTAKSILMQNDSGAPYWKHVSDVSYASKSTITLHGYSGTSYTVTNTSGERYTGTIGSNESVAVKVSGFGVYTINYTYSGKTKTKTVNVNAIGLYSVDCYIASFAADPYSKISTVSKNGTASSLYAIGDTKAVTLNGTVGAYNFSNETTYMFIVAFDHNSSVEMAGSHHMICSFAKSAATGGKDIAFVDAEYGNFTTDTAFHMNTYNVNGNGWNRCHMRNTICSQFKNAIPSDLQAILRSRTIYTDNTGEGTNNASNVTATTDYVYIPSEFEVHGSRKYANSYEKNYQQQLAYYKNGASKIRYRTDYTYMYAEWWLRSPTYDDSHDFCMVSTDGSLIWDGAGYAKGFAPLITL